MLAIKPLQKKSAQQDDTIKRAPVNPLTMESDLENVMEIYIFFLIELFCDLLILLVHTYLIFLQ